MASELADLAFDFGRLVERTAVAGPGAVQRLAQAESASLSWWTRDRIAADRLALWLSYRIGAADEDGGGLIRTAWAARRLMVGQGAKRQGTDLAALLAGNLGEDGRYDDGLIADTVAALEAVSYLSPIALGCALFHLWRRLDERPDHLRRLKAAVLRARAAARQDGGAMPFLPLSLTGFTADLPLTASVL